MSYNTQTEGLLEISPPLNLVHTEYIKQFSNTKRYQRRDIGLADDIRHDVSLPFGTQGEYFVGGKGKYGQDRDDSIINYYTTYPPKNCPSFWCAWEVVISAMLPKVTLLKPKNNQMNDVSYKWLEYLVQRFLTPWGYEINGVVKWQGDTIGDIGIIAVKKNIIQIKKWDLINRPTNRIMDNIFNLV